VALVPPARSTLATAASGGGIAGDVFRCALKPVAHALVDGTYGDVVLSDAEAASIVARIEKASGRTVEATRKVDPELVGGMILQAGSMRVDANVSVRRPGEPFGTRCEIKNVNSVRSVGRAIEYEAKRQIQMLEAGEPIRQQTRHWDEGDSRTHTLRDKEDADDYRYFLEPDLVPLDPSPEWVEQVRAALPMLPAARRTRLSAVSGLAPDSESVLLVVERGHDDYVLAAVAAGADAKRAVVHVQQNLDDGGVGIVPASALAALIAIETGGRLTATQAKTVLAEMASQGELDPAAIAARLGFEAMDTSELERLVDDAIAAQPDAWAKFCAGEQKALGAIVGHIMKASKGQADGKLVNQLLTARTT